MNRAQTTGELDALRKSVNRGAPYCSENWTMGIANMLELEFTLHPRGRPRKEKALSHIRSEKVYVSLRFLSWILIPPPKLFFQLFDKV